MEEGNEKSLRLQKMLQEALTPITDKLNILEQEVVSLRKEQHALKEMLEDKQKNN
ncbi:hypothetical protein KFZ56_13100 [Virgibacillus sp. NKC19-3]|uniref:hypothetical protein n=1 Tax=Virgibacillus saliphilus TaxID=2831674 RepID=UPI001C9AF868|nr:hypothetical protein [Virgibacillus sp. NKC19-3]MBY7143965.1 hypothetical protein [Virgibacillus sp. NKC19-3]